MRVVYLFITGVVVAIILLLRECVDRKIETLSDTEVVRSGEEHLGNWASKSEKAFIFFRLHRDGVFSYQLVEYPHNDTVRIMGSYDIIGAGNGKSTDNYPRLIAVDAKNDTLFNYFIAYITPYDTRLEKLDKMVLSPNGVYDTAGYTFYRVKNK